MVAQWLKWGDMVAVYDVVPAMARTLRVSVPIGLLLNLAVLILYLRKGRASPKVETGQRGTSV